MIDIIEQITLVYKKYECPKNVDCENKHIEFWVQCMKTGIAEIEEDSSPENIKKEFADMAFIAIDGLTKMGYDTRKVLQERLETNSRKELGDRDINFYIEKEKKIRSRL